MKAKELLIFEVRGELSVVLFGIQGKKKSYLSYLGGIFMILSVIGGVKSIKGKNDYRKMR